MTPRSKTFAWQRVSLLALAAATIAMSDVRPAAADYTRSCTATLEVRPSGTSTARKAYRWSVRNTVTHYYQVNEARREARRAITSCVRAHWDARDVDAVPSACQSHGSLEVRDYPFVNMAERLDTDLCVASPTNYAQDVDLVLFIEGKRGCVVDGGNINPATRVDIASGYHISCPVPPLPGIRLPGHDISRSEIPGQDWRRCRQLCQDTAACRAWTWRRAGSSGAGSAESCLLKSAAGVQVRDSCCHSGTRD
ncbi:MULTISPECIES: PAN domain-containing protein [unclassified Bradyrhizobium]|uniref:PAN domain-containing protein n=1 Tax=unclassified Bradyrhizobium TaxID=2631580 RepID=UPI0028EB0EF6|nr:MULTISPECIES: PAN domain-containing protein [unclassified Bradyrhizobium]